MNATQAAQEIGRLTNRMLELAPIAGLRVGIKIEPAKGIVTATADETQSGSVERSEIEPGAAGGIRPDTAP